ncbi:uncharacterized protein N7515_010161 [Penicillium bovifimosum]|uniref:Uncharacterized protein n=1 Tax=Penicillium bovifimosum TaxID=126998 RepID=A0A9W9KV64_9EURO|nr:uncharacterized protein N7515_010161 [Penicillium bovifimosum]KAJ5120773.1 hypothetical protein N7515_010161 [Penicillium bovifimosum]
MAAEEATYVRRHLKLLTRFKAARVGGRGCHSGLSFGGIKVENCAHPERGFPGVIQDNGAPMKILE